MKIHLYVLALVLCISPMVFAESDEEIHTELRQILTTVENAINTGNFDAMLPVLSENLRITPVNQEVLSSRKDVSKYFNKWFGPDGFLKTVNIKFTADALTELSDDKLWGVVRGSGEEIYALADGRPYTIDTRWTALVVKETDGHWRIRTMHIATNFLDNPILAEAENALAKVSIIALLIGVIIGIGGAILFRRFTSK